MNLPVFIAMFISPGVAIAVSLGTAFGFLLSLPFIVTVRALSHLVFAIIGSVYLQKFPDTITSPKKLFIFNIAIAIIHATSESIAVAGVYFLSPNIIDVNYFTMVFLMIGIGGFIHSIVDFFLAQFVLNKLSDLRLN